MASAETTKSEGCGGRCAERLPFDIAMAFQPIIDADAGKIFAHEALVRGVNGEGAGWVLGQIDDGNRYAFDQTCRVKAIETAAVCRSTFCPMRSISRKPASARRWTRRGAPVFPSTASCLR